MKPRILLAVALAGATASLQAASVNVSGQLTADTTWTADNEYMLSGYVFVTQGATLTIEPGTKVFGEISSGAGAAALVITAGSKIMAEGTADNPIIFTSALDSLDGSLGYDRKALWGGLLVLGNASINSRANNVEVTAPVQDQIEGMSVSSDQIPLITFGGTDDDDNSGVIKYVSIRHGGADLGAGNEINGLTLGGIGSGTTISYVEVFANFDDGFEFFGGTVSADHLVASFCGDDSFDFDQGYRGSLQYLFTIQRENGELSGDKGIEWDGATTPRTATPISNVTVSNLTAIGRGPTSTDTNAPINPRDNATVNLHNSVFLNFARGIEIESDIGEVAPVISSNLWWSHVESANTTANWGTSQGSSGDLDATSYFTDTALNNAIDDPMLAGVSYEAGSTALDPRPADRSSPIWTLPRVDVSGAGLVNVDYVGAFGNDLWIRGWTNLAIAGYLPLADVVNPIKTIGEDFAVDIVRGSSSKPINLSVRADIAPGSPLIAGFVIGGSQTQTVLIRGVGPSLEAVGVPVEDVLPNVRLQLYRGSDLLVTSQVVTAQSIPVSAELGAFALDPDVSGDATMLALLSPGLYTAQVSGVDGASGNVLVEIYELD